MEIRFSQSARKHRIAKGRALEVITMAEPTDYERADGMTGRRWVGADSRGLELEVFAVVKPDRNTGEPMLLIIQIMPTTFRSKEEE